MKLSHSRAALLMVLVTLMWSIAGVVTRHLEAARSFEVTFWRSAFNALALVVALAWLRGGLGALVRDLRRGGWPLWASGLCWTVMFTNFMVAIMLTTVATVLITMSIAPLLTALFARLFLRHALPLRTWVAIAVAGVGIAWMFGQQALAGGGSMTGALVALGVPIAGASNWTLLQHLHQRHAADPSVAEPDMLPAVLIGALLSALATLPVSLPFAATPHDLGLLAMLGVVQLAIPCLLSVQVARVLPAPDVSLIGLLEVIFGVLLAWVGAGEAPGPTALTGGALVVGALLVNEWLGLRQRAAAPV
ncbi:MAG: permease [Burkholderiales bacterium PBB5]|nr:MAG: permease [Burkholderiales bacterium PBB5]